MKGLNNNVKNLRIFEKSAQEYDSWFDSNKFVYESEVLALKKFVPLTGKGVEVAVGTGKFAIPLGIKIGVEPAEAMADIARKRGIEVYNAIAENLPFDNESFDFVVMVTAICFFQNPIKALQEVRRVLKHSGYIIIGMIDKDSRLGKLYESKKEHSKFYRYAHFYPVNEVLEWLKSLEFGHIKICQTIFKNLKEIKSIEPVKDGYGEGSFVVISSRIET